MNKKTPKPIATPILDAVFNDEETRELAKKQSEIESLPGRSHYEMTEDPDVLAVGKVIENAKYLDASQQPVESEVKGIVDASSVTANHSSEEIQKLFSDFRKELQSDIKNLVDERLDRDLKVKESFPQGKTGSWRDSWEASEKRRHEETKTWLKKFRESPVASKLAEALIVGDTFKTPWGRKLAVKLFELDRKAYAFLNNISNAEFVVTRHNVVSKIARKILGTKLPDEPEFVSNDTGAKTTRWADIANKAAKISHIKDSEPERVISNSKDFEKSKSWEDYITKEIKKGQTN